MLCEQISLARFHWQDLLDCEDGNIYYFDDGMFKLRKTKDPGVTHCLKKKKKCLGGVTI